MERFLKNMSLLGLTFVGRKTMEPMTPVEMEKRDREDVRKSYADRPNKRLLVREGYDTMIVDMAYAAAEQALTTLSERLAAAPLTPGEKNVAGVLAMLMLAGHHAAIREAMLLNVGLLAGLSSVPGLDIDGTESFEQLLAKLAELEALG